LYRCKTWSPILREEDRLQVSENKVLMRIFGPKRAEVAGGWRRLPHNFYDSPYVIRVIKSRRMRWEGYITQMR
jgi:hypothetical protein